ncbi:MAG: hypothetical protein AAGF99_08165 [Bacteroidota bacterium]
MEIFFENIGLLIFLFFLFLQFIGSLLGQRKQKRPAESDEAMSEAPASDGPSSFEEALRQIQEALREANQPQTPRSDPASEIEEQAVQPASVDDEEDALAFQHFNDFEQRGTDHFSSGAHAEFEAAEARREAAFERPLKTDRPTRIERNVAGRSLRGQRSMATVDAPASARGTTPAPASASLNRLREKLRSAEAVQDAYRLHVILGEPRYRRRR